MNGTGIRTLNLDSETCIEFELILHTSIIQPDTSIEMPMLLASWHILKNNGVLVDIAWNVYYAFFIRTILLRKS
jgi:hypothetical protein